MDIYFYNTLTKKKEKFEPQDGNEVRMYSCGPTVYKDATIGNMRTNIFQDILRRVLKYNGYTLKHAMNITDVGHLVSDGDEGEDKMIKSAKEMKKSPLEIAEHYTKLFFEDLKKLNIETPEIICKATDHIQDMINYVQKLMDNGYAYETSTAIYFDVSKLDEYGILSGVDLKEQKAGARVDVDNEKRNPYDFALWIKAPENHLMKWDSPWGLCYPGWHIECSAMGQKYLGETFDIHTGGIDLIPTHHENEIAQSKGACGKIPARFWMHGEYLLIDGGKMSKSLNNVYLVKDIEEKGYDPLVYRLFTYSSSYRNKINFTWDGMEANSKALIKLREGYQKHLQGTATDGVNEQSLSGHNLDEQELSQRDLDKAVNEFEESFHKAINDDLNMPQAMSVVWDVVKYPIKSKKLAELLLKFDTVLALNIDAPVSDLEKDDIIPNDIIKLADERQKARDDKNWAESDRLRDEILAKGYSIKDSKDGYEISKI